MSGEMAVALVLNFKDAGSAEAKRAFGVVQRSLKDTEGVARETSGAAISAFRKLADARQVLGIRSEKAIQNELHQTEAAYQRLAASGQASSRELARAQEAMKGKVAELRRELEGVKASAGGVGPALRSAVAGVAAWQAGKAVLSGPVGQTMSYDRQLAGLANTAFAGQSIEARRAGMGTLDAAINAAVRAGGGTREGALATLDKLVASGAFSDVREATGMLPMLTKAATASGADPTQLADIAIRAKQTFGLKDTGLALDQAIRAGQLGGFELKDMAKWLPQQMAAARQAGLSGDEGFRTLLAANQAAAITAGSKDEAGNNLVNLLGKINSQDTANDAKKLGIDLAGSLAAARAKGVNGLDAFVNLAEQVSARDPRFVALREQARKATGDEQRALYGSMADIMQGSAIGKIVQDRQALMALVGVMGNRDYVNNVRDQTADARGTGEQNFALIAGTPSFKAEQLAAEKAIALQAALDQVNPALGNFAGGLVDAMRAFPTLSAAVAGATVAVAGLGAAATAAAVGQAVLGGGAGGAAAGIAARLATAGAGALAIGGAALPWIGGALAVGAGAYGLYELVSALMKPEAAKEPQRVQVEVDVKNGNIVAAVNEAAERKAARH